MTVDQLYNFVLVQFILNCGIILECNFSASAIAIVGVGYKVGVSAHWLAGRLVCAIARQEFWMHEQSQANQSYKTGVHTSMQL